MHQSAIVPRDPSEELVRLRHVIQGTLATARALGTVDDDEFQRLSNQTIEAMTPDMMIRLAELAYEANQILWKESQSRVGFVGH